MTVSSRNDDEVVSFSDTSRRNDAEMAVRKGFPQGRAHLAHLLRYGSSRTRTGVDLIAKPCIWTKWARLSPPLKVVRLLMKRKAPDSEV